MSFRNMENKTINFCIANCGGGGKSTPGHYHYHLVIARSFRKCIGDFLWIWQNYKMVKTEHV